MQLDFSKLYHKSALDPAANNGDIFNVPGVYIWGFVYHKKEHGIWEPVDFTKEKAVANPDEHVFIPYYVGIARNKRTVSNRLFNHLAFRNNHSNKRTRIEIDKIPNTLSNVAFPLNPMGKDQHGISNNTQRFLNYILNPDYINEISYFNDANVLNLLYNNTITLFPQNTNYPIQNQIIGHGGLIPDSLNTLSSSTPCISTKQCYNNFFFCLYEQGKELVPFDSVVPVKLTLIEAVCVLMLKGKTLGQFQNLKDAIKMISDPNFEITDNTGFNIFKQPNAIRIDPNRPIELGNIAFLGYLQTTAL
jgi:hypothetical protein